jgi:hypothetical protein
MFVHSRLVLIFNNNALVILTAMTEKQGNERVKSAFVKDDNNKAKLIAGIATSGIMVISALLLSGLALISSYQQPVIAQQQTITSGGGLLDGGATITDNNITSTTGSAAQDVNATSGAGGAGGNQSELRMHLEEARTALQNDDTEGALIQLDLALNSLGGAGGIQGNMTAGTNVTNTSSEDATPTIGGTSEADEDSECGGVTVGGTSAADDYGCPPDPDA